MEIFTFLPCQFKHMKNERITRYNWCYNQIRSVDGEKVRLLIQILLFFYYWDMVKFYGGKCGVFSRSFFACGSFYELVMFS